VQRRGCSAGAAPDSVSSCTMARRGASWPTAPGTFPGWHLHPGWCLGPAMGSWTGRGSQCGASAVHRVHRRPPRLPWPLGGPRVRRVRKGDTPGLPPGEEASSLGEEASSEASAAAAARAQTGAPPAELWALLAPPLLLPLPLPLPPPPPPPPHPSPLNGPRAPSPRPAPGQGQCCLHLDQG